MGNRRSLAALYWRRIRAEGIASSVARVVAHPKRIAHHARRLLLGDATGTSNRFRSSQSRAADASLVAQILGVPRENVEALLEEIERDELIDELRQQYGRYRPEWAEGFDPGRWKIVYALVRLGRPRSVLETGVHDGLSSSLILRAMERNDCGELTSIDLPSTDLPVGATGPGWIIPERLRQRWTLRVGDSRKLLPSVAAALAPIDVFIHDSDHSRAHREFEFRSVRDFLSPTGIMISDDDEPEDGLLDGLAAEWSMAHRTNVAWPADGPVIGTLSR